MNEQIKEGDRVTFQSASDTISATVVDMYLFHFVWYVVVVWYGPKSGMKYRSTKLLSQLKKV